MSEAFTPTLRQFYAAAALTGLLANGKTYSGQYAHAALAFKYADEMITLEQKDQD